MQTIKLTTDSPLYNQFKDEIEFKGTITLTVGEDCDYFFHSEKQKGYGRTGLYLTVLFNGKLYETYVCDCFPNFMEGNRLVTDDYAFTSYDQDRNMDNLDPYKYDNIGSVWNDDSEEGKVCRRRLNRFCGMNLIIDGTPITVDLNGQEVTVFDNTYFNGTEIEFEVEIEELEEDN